MKQAIIIGVVGLVMILGVNSAEAVIRLVKGTVFGTVGSGADVVTINKIVDGDTTCYISQHGKYGSQAISCVK